MTKYTHEFFAALACPASVTWTNDIKSMFTPLDVDHMKKAKGIDLSDYDSTKLWAVQIYMVVAPGPDRAMPPPQSGEPYWPQSKVDMFGCWIQKGCPM